MPLLALAITEAIAAGAITKPISERALDEVLADSFPASDPPSWNSGITRPEPAGRSGEHRDVGDAIPTAGPLPARRTDVLDVSLPSQGDGGFISAVGSFGAVIGIVLLVPFVFLLVGLPIVLLMRGLIEAMGWLSSLV